MSQQMISISDFENYAVKHLSKASRDYYQSGANYQQTLTENREAFLRLRIRPRFLRDVSNRDLSTTILGSTISMPICVSPTAMQRMAHPLGEVATAKACESMNTLMILSTIATSSIEQIAENAPKALKWFQLYIYKDREVTRKLVKRAENNGFKALVLTIDTPMFGHRYADSRNKFHLPPHLRMANFDEGLVQSDSIQNCPTNDSSGLNEYASSLFDASITWNDVDWLNSITYMPLVLKGILTKEDAVLALKHGVSAILVSNHGARQLDGVPSTIEALPEVVSAVQNRCEVYLDGGVRTGTDVLKAIAFGAKAVFIGRPVLWGLTYDGENGVKQVLEILRNEFDMAMALSGCSRLDQIEPSLVVHQNYFTSNL